MDLFSNFLRNYTYKFENIFTAWSQEVQVEVSVKKYGVRIFGQHFCLGCLSAFNDLNGDEIIGTFYEKELQKTNQQEFRIEKVIKRKGDKLYVKWKGYDSSFNSWIDKKDLV